MQCKALGSEAVQTTALRRREPLRVEGGLPSAGPHVTATGASTAQPQPEQAGLICWVGTGQATFQVPGEATGVWGMRDWESSPSRQGGAPTPTVELKVLKAKDMLLLIPGPRQGACPKTEEACVRAAIAFPLACYQEFDKGAASNICTIPRAGASGRTQWPLDCLHGSPSGVTCPHGSTQSGACHQPKNRMLCSRAMTWGCRARWETASCAERGAGGWVWGREYQTQCSQQGRGKGTKGRLPGTRQSCLAHCMHHSGNLHSSPLHVPLPLGTCVQHFYLIVSKQVGTWSLTQHFEPIPASQSKVKQTTSEGQCDMSYCR